MADNLHWQTVTPLLRSGLTSLMAEQLFDPFRLVGGTALSLQLGHRISVDIDLFTDAPYETIDFREIDDFLRHTYNYVSPSALPQIVAMGVPYILGNDKNNAFKLDLYYTDDYIRPVVESEGIRMATVEEIIAMKIDVIQRGGRKKDFWDIHELMDRYTIEHMITLHKERYPYGHDEKLIRQNFTTFASADDDLDPVCLRGKHWEIIKLDLLETVNER